jgi:hypothetical protein
VFGLEVGGRGTAGGFANVRMISPFRARTIECVCILVIAGNIDEFDEVDMSQMDSFYFERARSGQ